MSTSPRRIDKYELQERLGRGGTAEVWKALDTQLGRYVAIKVLRPDLQNDPSFTSRFEREAQVIASLHHPNIVQLYDFRVFQLLETDETIAYMVMDYVEGQTLAQHIRKTSRAGIFPPSQELLQLFTPICLAVDYAHQKGMIHRDIKPSNILLDQRRTSSKSRIGEPVLSDFGIAKLIGATTTSLSGAWLGTPAYISPEQVMGSPGNERSDMYSLCVVLYETCTGVQPFQGDTTTAVMMQHINATPMLPSLINPAISPSLNALIMRGLAKAPQARFASAAELAAALAEALNLPVPESVGHAVANASALSDPTYVIPDRSSAPWTPSTSAPANVHSSGVNYNTPLSGGASLTPNLTLSTPLTPAPPPPLLPPPHTEVRTQPTPPASPPNKRRRNLIIFALLAVLLLLGSIGTILLLSYKAPQAVPTSSVVGHAYFISSGQLNQDNSQGINDELLIDLHAISAPPPGKAYYAWLLSDKSKPELPTIALGLLHVNQGNVSLLYPGKPDHSNLLAQDSRLLITEEDAANPPTLYTPDYKVWRYYAEISQAPSPRDKLHFTMLDHLRHLTSDAPELQIRGLRGGLDMWFLRDTQKILEWGTAARDDWRKSPDLLHRQLIRILDYIDGSVYVQKDVPSVGKELLADASPSKVPLLGPPPNGNDPPGYSYDDDPAPPGYVYLIPNHLAGTVLSPDATDDQRTLAAKLHDAVDQVKSWFEQIHQDAKQLVQMNSDQLAQPSSLSLLNDMVTQMQYAYSGQTDPLTGQSQNGVIWIASNIQRMANFEVKPYK